jgi:DNA-binding transcriptional regulator YhcF (GntR family)
MSEKSKAAIKVLIAEFRSLGLSEQAIGQLVKAYITEYCK